MWFDATVITRFADDGTIAAVYTIARDVEAQQRLARADAAAAEALSTVTAALEASRDGFGIFDITRDANGDVAHMIILHANSTAVARDGGTPSCAPRRIAFAWSFVPATRLPALPGTSSA